MEGEAFDPSPQSSMEREAKQAEDVTMSGDGSGDIFTKEEVVERGMDQPVEGAQTWKDMVQSKVQPLLEHPYVAQSAETVRQTIGQGTAKLQPIVNHPYVQKSTEMLSKSAEQVSSSAAQVKPLVGSKLQPVVGKASETVQLGKDTAKKIYNKEEGYEPAKVAPYFAGSLGVLILFILLAGWSTSDGSSKYNVDVSKIVAEKIKLPNGRHIAYVEQGASREDAKHNILFAHGLLSSRLLGLSGVNEDLLKKYSVRFVSYDRPGIGQSDPHLKRTLNSSAEDMADIADSLGMGNKFWVMAHSGGAAYAWAALHYIPNRLAGVAMLGPLMNPYAKNTTKEESKAMWAGIGGLKSTFQFARNLPSFVPGKLNKSGVKKVNKYMKNTKKRVNSKDRALLETDAFGEAWERATRESVRSGDPKPHAQDIILQAQDWGFQLSDIRPKPAKKSFFKRIFGIFGGSELPGFSGPIHIFHGTEDKVVPLVMSEYVKRILPQVELHKLEGEGHYSWFFNCDHCQRELFKTLFGEVAGLEELDNLVVPDETTTEAEPQKVEENVEAKAEEPVKHHEPVKPEGYFAQGPAKPEEGPLNDLAIAQKEAEKIALFKEAGQIPPIESSIGISPEQYDELQRINNDKHEEIEHEIERKNEAKNDEL
ncbi:hypothetical protein M758_11G107000 [Ceratodon purpureus]|nr:hypothetical protein M758_11G107000 [Ceratodon purpureus]KAG0601394.1 hypothetical protein M758_11G107000 [Ceratodon purpureus]KAG0601395.1 hypothetical protein M758_11G107000 [Ceratodon purpureus]